MLGRPGSGDDHGAVGKVRAVVRIVVWVMIGIV